MDKISVASADSIRVTLTLTNVSIHPVTVPPAQGFACADFFEVMDAQARAVATETDFCVLVNSVTIAPVALLPGESVIITDWWKPAFSRLDGQPLAPGAYRLRGRAAANNRPIYTEYVTVSLQP